VRIHRLVPALLALLLLTVWPVFADSRAQGSSATIAVVGDSLADGMWGGLQRTVHKDKRYKIFRGAKNSIGFTGSDLIDMLDKALAAGETHAVVMMIGANDRRTIFIDGKPKSLFRTPGWVQLYSERVARFMDHAGRKGVPLIWIQLPVMRAKDATADAQLINGIVVEAARSRPHVHLVETASITSDEKGEYVAHFRDLAGTVRAMRTGDGVHFEQAAYELFADIILKKLREASPHLKQLAAGE
jgi:uncharacterized protein